VSEQHQGAEGAPDGTPSAALSSAPARQASSGVPSAVGNQPSRPPLQAMSGGDGPSKRTMPTDFSIALRANAGSDTLRSERDRGPRQQSMRGFEDTYVDIIDYIVRITDRIWEYQDIGYIYDTYSPACMVFDDRGATIGVERIVTGTINTINAFPDATHWADDVIWAGDDEEGFVTSHRYVGTAHHLGAWRYGPATGRKVNLWGIANCVIRENEIYEEWVLYNMCSRLMQLGIDVKWAAREYGNETLVTAADQQIPEIERLSGGRHPEYYPDAVTDRFDVEHFVRKLWHDMYNRRDLSAVGRAYARTVRWHGTSDRVGYGRGDVRGQALNLLATFPDLNMQVDEVYYMGNDVDGYRVSLRWTALGTHRGYAMYGPPTGRRVRIWGISQLYIHDAWITEEWSCFNEFDVLAQLLGDQPRAMIS
jgi:predicted ester cyclase